MSIQNPIDFVLWCWNHKKNPLDTEKKLNLSLYNHAAENISLYPEKLENYWIRKFYAEVPTVTFMSEKKEIMENIKLWDFVDKRPFLEFLYRNEGKLIQNGESVVVMDVSELNGKKTVSFKVQDVIIYSEYKDRQIFIETIGNFAKGTIPIIEHRRYGLRFDEVWHELSPKASRTDIDALPTNEKNDLKKLLNTRKKLHHNLGVLRAMVFTNKVTNQFWNGQPDITMSIALSLFNVDKINGKILDKIELESTSVNIFSSALGTIGGRTLEEQQKLDDERNEDIREKTEGAIKTNNYSADMENGADYDIFEGSPEFKSLREEIQVRLIDINKRLGINEDYDSSGKTNDVEAKIDRTGDDAKTEGVRRRSMRQSQFEELMFRMTKILKLEEVHSTNVHLNIADYRKTMQLLKARPEILGLLPSPNQLVETFNVDLGTAREMIKQREEEAKTSLVSFLSLNNNNLPAGIELLKGLTFVDKEAIEKRDKMNMMSKQNTDKPKENNNEKSN